MCRLRYTRLSIWSLALLWILCTQTAPVQAQTDPTPTVVTLHILNDGTDAGYWVDFSVSDPSRTLTTISVTGPGIATAHIAFTYDTTAGIWRSQAPVFLAPGPAPPVTLPTYAFALTETGSTDPMLVAKAATGFVTDVAADLVPRGNVNIGTAVILSWTAVIGATAYDLEVMNAQNQVVWYRRNLQPGVVSVVYNGPTLEPGALYHYSVRTSVDQGGARNHSLARGSFIYVGLGDINGNGQVTLRDAILSLRVAAGAPPTEMVYKRASVSGKQQIGIGDVIYILRGIAMGETPPPVAELARFSSATVTDITADGALHLDAKGVGMSATPGTVENGTAVRLIAAAGTGGPLTGLLTQYDLITDFYQALASGRQDSAGRVQLVLPGTNIADRIVAIVGASVSGLLDVEPINGKLTVNILAGPEDRNDLPAPGKASAGEIRYAVARPKTSPAGARTALAADTPRDCSFWSYCRTKTGKVSVYWYESAGITKDQADKVVAYFEQGLDVYKNKGFTAANLDPKKDSPLSVWVSKDHTTPIYSPWAETIYLPPDVAKDIGAASLDNQGTISHEMAHYVQDGAYNMTGAYVAGYASGAYSWWLETSAERMTFLVDDEFRSQNAAAYGQTEDTSTFGGKYTTQMAPLTWYNTEDGAGGPYFHAQLVHLNTCDTDACVLTASGFVQAINNHTYPFSAAGALAKVNSNLASYADYLLGIAPAGFPAPPESLVKSFTVGDYVVGSGKNAGFTLDANGTPPRVTKTVENCQTTAKIDAAIEENGVYLLEVQNTEIMTPGGNLIPPTWPMVLTVEGGSAPLRYRIDGDAEIKIAAGGGKLLLQPISKNFGISAVRLAALGKSSGGNTFKARIAPVDLEGDWVAASTTLISSTVTHSDPRTSTDPAEILKQVISQSQDMASRGSFLRKPSLPENIVEYAETGAPGLLKTEGSGRMTADRIDLNISQALTSSPAGTGTVFGGFRGMGKGHWLVLAAGVLTVVGLIIVPRRRYLMLAILGCILATTIITACAGLKSINRYNTGTAMQFTKLEYVGSETNPAQPLWKLTGEGYTDIDGEFVYEDTSGETPTTYTDTITGRITYTAVVYIYKEGTYVAPE